jgi:phosphatidate cytidylyltransferase
MAFNLQTFKTRSITAAFFVAVMVGGLLISHWTFFILFSVIHFGCWIEYQRIVGLIDRNYQDTTPFHKYGVMIAGWCLMLYFTKDVYHIFGLRLHELGWWLGLVFIFLLPLVELLFAKQIHLKNIGHSFFGLIYISLSLGLMMDLYAKTTSPFNNRNTTDIKLHDTLYVVYAYFYPLLIIASIWINDTMAYIMGSLIGKTQMSRISPKKTWEGTISGIILSAAVIFLLSEFVFRLEYLGYWLTILAVIASVAGTFGDLLESKLKRLAGVKDSGHIMPGHGGFLDRFDSLLIATPFVWLFIYFFIK